MNHAIITPPAPSVQVSTISSYIEISIDRDITEPEDFRDEIAAIRSAKESDVLHITVNTGGGSLDTAMAIIAAMRQSKAHIICEAVGTVASAGTLIFLAGHEFRVNDGVEYMMHTASFRYGGKANNVAEYVNFQQNVVRKMVESSYKNFLTQDEIEKLLSGTDFWMDSEEVCRRLQLRQEALEKEQGVDEITREELESWSHERLVSFIYDEDYSDEVWESQQPVPTSLDDITSTLDMSVLRDAANDLGLKFPHNIKLETLRSKIIDYLNN